MRKINKVDLKKFYKEVRTGLIAMGAEQTDRVNVFNIETLAGKMKVTIDDTPSVCFSLFCRFEDAQRARKEGIKCNPFSGKYNIHLNGNDLDSAIEESYKHIEMTLDQKELDKNLKKYYETI